MALTIKPYDYQERAVRDAEALPGRVAIVAPTGCLAGDTMININRAGNGKRIRLDELVRKFNGGVSLAGRAKRRAAWRSGIDTLVRARLDDGSCGLVKLVDAYVSGVREVFAVEIDGGFSIRATADHRFLTSEGWKPLRDISPGDLVECEPSRRPVKSGRRKKKSWSKLRVAKQHPHRGRRGVNPLKGGHTVSEHRLALEASMNGLSLDDYIERVNKGPICGLRFLDPKLHVHHIDGNHHNNSPENLKALSNSEHQREHEGQSTEHIKVRTELRAVTNIKLIGVEPTYDLSMAGPNNFLANGIVVHNSGKTVLAAMLTRSERGTGLVFAHTRDLVLQMASALREFLGEPVGVVMAGETPEPFARVQVASVQTLLAREWVPEADVVVWDEAHHCSAEEWSVMANTYPRMFGLTATPERADGVTLRGVFDHIVVAAHYSELIRRGVLVPARVLRPKAPLRGVALDPVTAILQYGEGRSGFLFGRTVKLCRDYAEKLTAFGVPAACVDAHASREDRRERIKGLVSGRYRILTSVYALTEGVNVPSASLCALARGCSHPSLLLQIAGRVLRSSPGKSDALLLDLPGVTWTHGVPHEDREYSLDGIKRPETGLPLSVCQACGFTQPPSPSGCGRCGFKPEAKDLAPRVHNERIAEHAQASPLERQLRLSALLIEAKRKGYEDDWVDVQFRRLFGAAPVLPHDVERKQAMWRKLVSMGKGVGYARARYRALYGTSAPGGW